LATGAAAYAEDRYREAAAALRRAKELAPRSASIRELLGLALYGAGGWEEALRELRAFRRLTGETIHMAMEMDCLRALGRDGDVEKVWELFLELPSTPAGDDEARVVFASFLLDRGRVAEAWRVIKPGRLIASPTESQLRRWAVAARVAAASGDAGSARRLVAAIALHETDAPWLEDLERRLGL
jgi:Flp pilus assembly protein TadD